MEMSRGVPTFDIFRISVLSSSNTRGFQKMLRLGLVEVPERNRTNSFMQSVSISADKESEVILNLSITKTPLSNYL